MVRQDRPISDLCQTCQWVEPWWGTVPFEEMPTDDSNTCAFDEPYVSRQTARRREKRARNRED